MTIQAIYENGVFRPTEVVLLPPGIKVQVSPDEELTETLVVSSGSTNAASDELREELRGVWDNCKSRDWDGMGAQPVTVKSLAAAERFIEMFPHGLPAPSVGAEPDGAITFEWYRSPRQTLSVSVSEANELPYAAILGLSHVSGVEVLEKEFPTRLLRLIDDVLR